MTRSPPGSGSEHPDDLAKRGRELHGAGRLREAEALYRRALALRPDHPVALHFLGVLALQTGHAEAAAVLVGRAVALAPADADARVNLGLALAEVGRVEEALESHALALSLAPDHVVALTALGNLLERLGRAVEAEAHQRRALALTTTPAAEAAARANLALTLKAQGRLDETEALQRQAVALDPSLAQAHHSLGMTLLLRGQFARGWREYAWRWRDPGFRSPRRTFPQPAWDGSDPAGVTLLLHAEQGLGDAVQFMRYAPLLAERGARVILELPPELLALAQGLEGSIETIAHGAPPPPFDAHAALLDLPGLLGTDEDSIPTRVPYLHAPVELVADWRARLGRGSYSVGLVWAGNPVHRNDRNRSMAADRLVPLLDVPGVRLFSLQVGERAREAPAGIVDLSPRLVDPSHTAAVLEVLDLLICVDTLPAHLAGALGRPAWVLLPFIPDWRWLWAREDSPWYPSLRLFRQRRPGDWDDVVRRVADALTTKDRRA